MDRQGKAVAAISVVGPSLRIKDEMIPLTGRRVSACAGEISLRLGYRNT